MVDFHSHILPQIDDGSQSVEESLQLLTKLKEQGIDTVVATPHYYANRITAEEFLQARNEAFERLKMHVPADTPKVLRGAEVRYYEGISNTDALKSLCVDGSKLLLLEMPMAKWTEYTVGELLHMASSGDVVLMLAHIERYLSLQKDGVWISLLENGAFFQVNATFLLDFRTRRKAIGMLKNGFVHFLGSDCHNLTDRPPLIGKAYNYISNKLGEDFLQGMIDFGKAYL